jgi:hypothetical protein
VLEVDAYPEPVIIQDFGLGHFADQVDVQQLILEQAVERFVKPVLPKGASLDVDSAGGAGGLEAVG